MTFYRTFDIYAQDASTKLANAQMNFWGTTYTVYDPETGQEIATLHRPFFRLKNDWTFTVINRPLLLQKNIDVRVLLTVIAFQSDKEYWQSSDNSFAASSQASAKSPQQLKPILEKINNLSMQQSPVDNINPDPKTLETVASELETGYKNSQFDNSENQTNQEQASNFVDYCINLVESGGISQEKKNVILHLLKVRLEGGTF